MKEVFRVLKTSVAEFSKDGCGFLSQTIAFNALFATFSLALLASAIFGALYGTVAGQHRTEQLIAELAPDSMGVIDRTLRLAARFGGIAGPVGFVSLIWSAKNLFLSIAFALDRALGVPRGAPLVQSTLTAIFMIPASGAILVIAAAAPVALSSIVHAAGSTRPVASEWVAYFTSFLMMFVLAAMVYRFLPNVSLTLREVVPAALVCAIGWLVLQVGFAFFATHTRMEQFPGFIARIFGLLIWFNLIGWVLLFGAEVAATLRGPSDVDRNSLGPVDPQARAGRGP